MNIKEVELINKERLDIRNSNEYNTGKRLIMILKLIKKFDFKQIIKEITKHLRIKKLSVSAQTYSQINNNNYDYNKKKIVVYTCVTGSYDNIINPLFEFENVDYILFTDNQNIIRNKDLKWNVKDINTIKETKELSLSGKNRYIKMHPHKLFKQKYDYAIYIDGNIEVVSDIRTLINSVSSEYGISMHKHRNRNDIYKEAKTCKILKKGNYNKIKNQMENYRKDGFPKEYGMLEANVIVIDLKNKTSNRIFDEWYEEFINSLSGRDQLSLPYVLWKKHISINDLATLGGNVYANPIFNIVFHSRGDKL